MFTLKLMAHRQLCVDSIKITPAVFMPDNVSGLFKFGDDFLDSPLGQPNFMRDNFSGAFGMVGDKDEYPSMIR